MIQSTFTWLKSALITGALGAVGGHALAGNTWTGGGASSNWSESANWGGRTPGYGTLTFSGSTATTNTNDSITAMNQLAWSGSSAWTLNPGGSTVLSLYDNGGIQAKIRNLGSGLVTVNAPITFAANSGSPANPYGEITSGTFTPPVGFQNNGVIVDSGVVKAASVAKSGNTVSIGINSYTGHIYQIQVSQSLAAGSFTNIGAPQAGSTGTPLVFTDSSATNASGFYRVVVAP